MYRLDAMLTLAGASLRGEFQYSANVVMSIVGGLIYQLTGFLVVWIIVDRFTALGGWTLDVAPCTLPEMDPQAWSELRLHCAGTPVRRAPIAYLLHQD